MEPKAHEIFDKILQPVVNRWQALKLALPKRDICVFRTREELSVNSKRLVGLCNAV